MEQKDKFALRWDNYEKTIVEVFQKIRGDHHFYDCTLVCNGIKINAHRVIISSCSPVFRDMLRISSHPHPVLYLRGVRQEDLEWILDFMYNGEVLLEESELEVFLKIAEELQVQGLCQVGNATSSSSTVNQDVHDILSDLEQPDQKRIKRDPELSKNEEKSKYRKAILSTFGPGVSVSVKKEPNSHPRRESNSTVASLQETLLHSPAGSTSSEHTQLLRSSPHFPRKDRVRTPPSTPLRPPSTPGGVKRSAPTDITSPGIPPQSPVSNRPQTLLSSLPPGFLQIHNNTELSQPPQFPQQPSVIPDSPSNSEIPDSRTIPLLRNVASPPVLHIPETLVEQASQPRSLPSSVQSSVQGAVHGSSHSNVLNYVQSSVSNNVLSGLLNSIPSNVQSIDLNNAQNRLQSGDFFNRINNIQYSVHNSTSRSVHNSVQSSSPNSMSHSSSIPFQIHGPHPAARPAEPYVSSNLLTQNISSILAGHAAALQRQELQGSNPGREISQAGNLQQSPGAHGLSGRNPQLGGVHGVHAQIGQPHVAQSVPGSSGQVVMMEDSQDKEYDAKIEEYIEREETPYGPILKCKVCPKNVKLRNKQTLISHVESTHLLATISCSNCDKTFKARNYLKQHLKRGVCTQNIGNT